MMASNWVGVNRRGRSWRRLRRQDILFSFDPTAAAREVFSRLLTVRCRRSRIRGRGLTPPSPRHSCPDRGLADVDRARDQFDRLAFAHTFSCCSSSTRPHNPRSAGGGGASARPSSSAPVVPRLSWSCLRRWWRVRVFHGAIAWCSSSHGPWFDGPRCSPALA